ncbi:MULTISPECIES: amino acid adenylation domain-containing SDR family oxidoreductase [Thiorhodovibrio]|uniref:amino acid adenylation domain-containing SDR family oxidoreductase n=1 Tax=Thiorhodovibrio TaxID=61593 RepID=UPI001911C461|nr:MULTISPECIES: amino acid adenylation domain-containing SDR family oxidoreductase [Thiorhodovibrio]MBK5967598.1 hypothetical protein [Thiorhodovibrio winogradskyi]WPL14949.1 Linear gramicidin synthase subunit D [Thiorhodovibrio litoralis]
MNSTPSVPADLNLDDPQTLPGLFSRVAARMPQRIAVQYGRACITYAELELLSNRVADWLHRQHRVEHGDLVCIAYPRGIDFMVAMLGALKCGAAYVPIDLREPLERRRAIVEDAAPKCLLVAANKRGDFDFAAPISLDDLKDPYAWSPEPRRPHIDSGDVACVFFTSGSTGRPKGVLLPHLSISGLILSPRYLSIDADDRVLSSSSIAFDAASFEIWTALLNGATLVCVDYETIINPEAFADFIEHQAISVMWVTSALFDQLVAFRPGMFRRVKYLLSGGDVVNPKTVHKVLNNASGRPRAFVNGYGPTETGILATFQLITELADPAEPLPIGKALADTVLYVLDENRNPVPSGETGELYIGGHRLAKGYLNLPERTAEHFLANPFTGDPTDRVYRTGDLVHFRDDGSLAFAGRADRQIKFRGFRLELDGIEQSLVNHPDIANAAVVMVKVKGEKVLVGYVQPEATQQADFDLEAYKRWLGEQLPAYSVPGVLMIMDALPVTSRGKIDRKRLPPPVLEETARPDAVKPRTDTERVIWQVWSQCLDRTEFGVTDDFFALGGSSILLATVYAGIRERIAKPFELDAFLQHPTIEGLAKTIDELGGQADHAADRSAAEADAVLDPSIQPVWIQPARDAGAGAVLLTGSTGFLGAHLLAELLEKTNRSVYCLIKPDAEAGDLQAKQCNALHRLGLDPGDAAERIRPVAGDLAQSGLGLSPVDAQRLRDHCSHIIHCGAFVHHIYGYDRLKAANTFSTLALIRLAMRGRPKKLTFVSTASAITEADAQGIGYEGRVGPTPADFFGGYALSKWVSERLLEQGFERGLSGLILRPGNIFANSRTGVASPAGSNFALLMMRAYLSRGLAPDLDLVFEAVPVDRLAAAMVALTMDDNTDREMLNLSSPHEIALPEYVGLLSELTGKSIEILPYEDWKRRVIAPLRETDPLYPLTLYFQGGPTEEIQHFETRQAQARLGPLGVEFPSDYRELLRNAFDRTLRGAMGL